MGGKKHLDERLWSQIKEQNGVKKKEWVRKLDHERSAGLEMGGTDSECESGVSPVTGALRLHDTWHVSSAAVFRSPATVLQLRMLQLRTVVEMTMRGKERNYAEPQASTWVPRVRTDWKVAVLPRIYPYHWCKDDPKSITSQLYVPGRGRGWALTRELQCLIHKEELIGNLKIESTLE